MPYPHGLHVLQLDCVKNKVTFEKYALCLTGSPFFFFFGPKINLKVLAKNSAQAANPGFGRLC